MATTTLPQLNANFETSLATGITAAATTLTLVTSTDDAGNALSGVYEFTIDEGTNNEEHMYVTMTGSSGSISRRGLSRVDAWTEVTANKFAHNRGASVKITNFTLVLVNRLLSGTDTFSASLNLASATLFGSLAFSGTDNTFRVPNLTTAQITALASPQNGMLVYDTTLGELQVRDGGVWLAVGIASVPNGSTTVAGIYQSATVAQQGTATANGSTGAALVPVNANLVKTSSGAGDENKLVVLGAAGTFADGFLNVATTSTADKIVKANGSGKIDSSWLTPGGVELFLYGDGSDGDVTITVDTSLSRDMFYNNLTVNNGFNLNPNGYKIFVRGTLTTQATGTIKRTGNNGTAGGTSTAGNPGGTAGTGGAALASGTLPGGVVGSDGGAGVNVDGAGAAGTVGASSSASLGVAGAAGGQGGRGQTAANAAGGAAGTISSTPVSRPRNIVDAITFRNSLSASFSLINSSAGSGGGGGGGGRTTSNIPGGGGGGAGSSGAVVAIYANTIVNAGTIGSNGGNGGNGGAGCTTSPSLASGGGGGGAGGPGGILLLVYSSLTNTGTIQAAGGTGGTGGVLGGGVGTAGDNGADGAAGTIIQIDL